MQGRIEGQTEGVGKAVASDTDAARFLLLWIE